MLKPDIVPAVPGPFCIFGMKRKSPLPAVAALSAIPAPSAVVNPVHWVPTAAVLTVSVMPVLTP